jgi:hypothetical protein
VKAQPGPSTQAAEAIMNEVIEFWECGRGEQLRLCVSEFRGQRLVDFRIWYSDPDGVLKPSRQGVTLKPELLAEVIAAFQAAQQQLSAAQL